LEAKLDILHREREEQLKRETTSNKIFIDIINTLKDSLFKLADELLNSNKRQERMMETFEGFQTKLKKVHDDPVHEKHPEKPKDEAPAHEIQQKYPLSKKRKPVPFVGRKVRKKT